VSKVPIKERLRIPTQKPLSIDKKFIDQRFFEAKEFILSLIVSSRKKKKHPFK